MFFEGISRRTLRAFLTWTKLGDLWNHGSVNLEIVYKSLRHSLQIDAFNPLVSLQKVMTSSYGYISLMESTDNLPLLQKLQLAPSLLTFSIVTFISSLYYMLNPHGKISPPNTLYPIRSLSCIMEDGRSCASLTILSLKYSDYLPD